MGASCFPAPPVVKFAHKTLPNNAKIVVFPLLSLLHRVK